jgi:hypothetical protein
MSRGNILPTLDGKWAFTVRSFLVIEKTIPPQPTMQLEPANDNDPLVELPATGTK